MADTSPTLFSHIASHAETMKIFAAGGASSDLLTGGALNEDQQLEVMKFIRSYAVMLAPHVNDLNQFPPDSPIGRGYQARTQSGSSVGGAAALVPGGSTMMRHAAGKTSGTYDQLHIGRPITRAATEGTQDADQYTRNPAQFGRRRFSAEKLRASWGATTEFFERNIRQGTLNQELARAMAPRLAQDFEDLAINGDTAIVANTDRGLLLRRYDGWLKQTREQCYQISAGGDTIEHAIFMQAIKSMPEEYSITDHKWWMHPWLWHDYIDKLSQRTNGGPASDAALAGQGLAPYGYPVCLVPSLPRNEAITLFNLATAGTHIGTQPGPFAFETNAFQINLNVNNQGVVTIVFPTKLDTDVQERLLTSSRVAAIINEQYAAAHGIVYGNVARVGQHGVIEFVSPTTGAGAASRIVLAAPANSALTALGLTAGTYEGVAAGGTWNTYDEGTVMWLSPAWNFVWHVVTDANYTGSGLRMYTKFDQGSDQVLTDIYSWQGASLMTPEACVVVNGLRAMRPATPVLP